LGHSACSHLQQRKKLSQLYEPFRFLPLSRGEWVSVILAIEQRLQALLYSEG